ncbi:MAG: GDP-mannose 4,6-dehydratase [Candidatus Methanomethylicaceae archaeon]
MNLLVTGAAGFIGSHLVDALLAAGHYVIGLDSFTDYYERSRKQANLAEAQKRAPFRLSEADLNAADLTELLAEIDLVYHLAGQPGVRGSWGSRFDVYVRNNVLATQRLLEAALTAGKVPVVYASSSSVYGDLTTMPLQEDMAPAPISPYGVTKLAAEHLCRLYSAVHGLPTISLRLFTVYGPRQRPDMAFQRFLTALRDGREITVYGDGNQTRDFTYVGDVVQAFVLAGQACRDGRGVGGVFNIAGGTRASLRHVLQTMEAVTGYRLKVRYAPVQPGDVHDTWADTSRAETVLGFRPQTSLMDGLRAHWKAVNSEEPVAQSVSIPTGHHHA